MDDEPKTPNYSLRRERQLRGWSQHRVADHLNTSLDVVSRWERGERKPSPFFQEKLCALYGKSAEQLGFIPSHSGRVVLPDVTNAVAANPVIIKELDHIESIINLAWEAWFSSRPRQASREVTKLLPQLERSMYASMAEVQCLHIKELVIRCHGLLGVINLDALQNDIAFYHYMQAYRFAEELHDINLAVTYLASVGDVLRRQNNQVTAIRYMEQARDWAEQASPEARGHVLQLLAYTYGDVGNEAAFEHAIAEATDLLAFTGRGRDLAKKEFIPFEIYEIRGKVYRDLGKPLQALPYLQLAEEALGRVDAVIPRWQALLHISRGQAYCDAGDLATGLEVTSAGFTMAYHCHSLRQMHRVRKLLMKLEESPWKGDRRVATLKELVHETYTHLDWE